MAFLRCASDGALGDDSNLYICVGSNTNGGVKGQISGYSQTESYLSATILVAHLGKPGFQGNITYSAPLDGVPISGVGPNGVEIFATGLRNPYGIVQHSNGHLYATDNGPNAGYGAMQTGCQGQQIADQTDVDELIRVVKGNYYGHPNSRRGATDPRQCVWRASSLPSGNGTTAPMMKIPSSTDGIIEFETNHFNGQMRGNLIMSKYQDGLFRVILSTDGLTVAPGSDPPIPLIGDNSLALTQGPNGNLFDTQHNNNGVFVYVPNEIVSQVSFVIKGVFPRRGVLAGGTTLSLYGNNFSGVPTVMIGDKECLNVDVVSTTLMKCRLPLGTLGPKDVVVTIDGVSDTFVNGYRYISGMPV
jgi:IPT/TIG domain/Glucose / Sorbosone dehydrogenase